MQRVSNKGLAGKARRTHKKTRAARLHSTQLIMNYLEPEADPVEQFRERQIPIRRNGRSQEYSTPNFEHVALETEDQLDLSLYAPESPSDAICLIPAGNLATERNAPHLHVENKCTPSAILQRAVAKRAGRRIAEASATFSLRGFLRGCALGGTAAAAVLLMAWVALT